MRPVILTLVLGALASARPVPAQPASPTSGAGGPPAAVVTRAQLKLVTQHGPPELMAGWLWRHPLNGETRRVARVDSKGTLDQPYACTPGDRLVGKPDKHVSTRSESQPCRDGVEFEFSVVRTVRLEEAPDGDGKLGNYLAAYSDLRAIYMQAAMGAQGEERSRYLAGSQAAETAAIWATAKALGDDQLENLVTLDPEQGYRLVLSKRGVSRIEELQRTNKLKVTGQLDFATLDLIGKMTPPGALAEPGEKLMVLPSDLLRDKAVVGYPQKSTGLVELSRATKVGN